MSYEKKVELFRAGKYKFPVPGTSTGYWSESDWIRFIDLRGVWTPNA